MAFGTQSLDSFHPDFQSIAETQTVLTLEGERQPVNTRSVAELDINGQNKGGGREHSTQLHFTGRKLNESTDHLRDLFPLSEFVCE